MRTLWQDLSYSFRQLIKMPGFTLTAILSLALGIGATTAVFSVVYAILVDPYPYAGADRMVHLRMIDGRSADAHKTKPAAANQSRHHDARRTGVPVPPGGSREA